MNDLTKKMAAALRSLRSSILAWKPEESCPMSQQMGKALNRIEESLAAYDAQPEQEPVAYLVCSVNADGSLSLEHAAAWEESAHEHINDAINEYGIAEAAQWVVRPAFVAPQENSNE